MSVRDNLDENFGSRRIDDCRDTGRLAGEEFLEGDRRSYRALMSSKRTLVSA